MKILIVEPETSGHRMALYVRLIVRGCVDRGWAVGLLTSRSAMNHPAMSLVMRECGDVRISLMDDITASSRVDALSLMRNQFAYYSGIARGFRACVAAQNPDVVYMNNLDYLDKVLAVRGSPFGNVPFSGMMMDMKFHRQRMSIGPSTRSDRLYEHLFRRVLRMPRLRTALVIDEAFASFAAESARPEYGKVRHVPDVGEVSGVEARASSRAALGLSDAAFVVLVYGSLTGRKGIRELLEAVSSPNVPANVVVLLAGVMDDKTRLTLQGSLARELMLAPRVFISEGFHDDIREYRVFNAADAVWLGYVDGFFGSSGVLFQSGSMGLPVIAQRAGLIGWLSGRHGLGIAVDPADISETSDALLNLASDRALGARLGANGRRLAERHKAEQFHAAVLDGLLEP